MSPLNKEKELEKIRLEVLALNSSPLYDYRIQNNYFPVIGGGSPTAEIMFIGEAPGRKEAETGLPFIGSAGKILDELLGTISLKREDVYITSVLKDRPPRNRDPLPKEIKIYGPFLERQIEIIKPKKIAVLGRFAMRYVMEMFDLGDKIDSIGVLHGKLFPVESSYGTIDVAVLYHPAAAIYNQKLKPVLLDDFKILR